MTDALPTPDLLVVRMADLLALHDALDAARKPLASDALRRFAMRQRAVLDAGGHFKRLSAVDVERFDFRAAHGCLG